MKIGNYAPNDLSEINLNDLRLRGASEESLARLRLMYEFPQKIIEFFTEVRRIEEKELKKPTLSCNIPALEGRYFLVCRKPIGAGGMCKVYLFYDRRTNQYVVFKLVPLKSIREAARLEREKSILIALNKLQSPHLVKVLGLGIADFSFLYATPSSSVVEQDLSDTYVDNPNVVDDVPCYENRALMNREPKNVHLFLVMPYIQGQTLESYCLTYGLQYDHYSANNKLFDLLKIILETTYQIAKILTDIHRLGLVHRDIKPNNIIMKEGHLPVLIDFGIAQRQDIKGDQQAHCTITPNLGTPSYSDPSTSQYIAAMKSLQEHIEKMIKDMSMNAEDMPKNAENWKSIIKESEQVCKVYPLQTQRLAQQIRQYQRNLFYQRCLHPNQWFKKQSPSTEQWNALEILVEELQRCSHPYEDVFSLGATLYWCLTGKPFADARYPMRYLGSPAAAEIKFTPSLFGTQHIETLEKIEQELSCLLTQMFQHPLEKRCSLKQVQQELKKIIKMLP